MKTWPSSLEDRPSLGRKRRPTHPRSTGGEQRPARHQRGGVPRTAAPRGERSTRGSRSGPAHRVSALQATRATRLIGGGAEGSALQWLSRRATTRTRQRRRPPYLVITGGKVQCVRACVRARESAAVAV